jgi:hypothetical protein
MNNHGFLKRVQLIVSYDAMIIGKVIEGWQPYFVNFMFEQIPGRKSTKLKIMEDEVVRVYSTLVTHVVRKPHAPSWNAYTPLFIGCPDAPVAKREKDLVRNVTVNDGWHFNGCLLLPPEMRCRLKGHLDDHFRENQNFYYKEGYPLDRVHVTRMSSATIADYTLKHFKRGNVVSDDILLLPRSSSEFTRSREPYSR